MRQLGHISDNKVPGEASIKCQRRLQSVCVSKEPMSLFQSGAAGKLRAVIGG